jgi:hypothetical protein
MTHAPADLGRGPNQDAADPRQTLRRSYDRRDRRPTIERSTVDDVKRSQAIDGVLAKLRRK